MVALREVERERLEGPSVQLHPDADLPVDWKSREMRHVAVADSGAFDTVDVEGEVGVVLRLPGGLGQTRLTGWRRERRPAGQRGCRGLRVERRDADLSGGLRGRYDRDSGEKERCGGGRHDAPSLLAGEGSALIVT
jgi:hypothetical protein